MNFLRESIRRIFISKTRGQHKNLSVEIIKLLREILSYQLVSISFFYTIIHEFKFYTGIMIYISIRVYIFPCSFKIQFKLFERIRGAQFES